MIAKRLSAWLLLVLMPILAACSDSSSVSSNTALLQVAAEACRAATTSTATLCRSECTRLADMQASAQCNVSCDEEEQASRSLCGSPPTAFERDCQRDNCPDDVMSCLDESGAGFDRCTESCATGNDFCANQCLARRAAEEHSCGFLPVPLNRGGIALPALAPGQPAHLSALLDDDEIAVVEAADRRSADHRQRSVRLWIDAAETPISITQIEHDFSFGVPLDSREFADGDGRLAFYSEIARPHANLLVAETSLKWRNTEREQGQLTFDLADFELDWAESLGFDIKAHVLLWGNPPPLASGSGTPEWLRNAFPEETLSTAQREELQRLIRARIAVTVERYRGRIDVWEVTNEMLNPLTSWFVDRLGPEVVDDAFRSAKLADPGAQLVYNEWISDIFTGVGGPDAQAVRDRVIELKQAGVPVDALGQQGHFAPALVNIGVDVDLSERTRIDDYADALEVLAEAGLPIHITEVTFAAPDEPELRAAQAEAIMRIWWGHPQVEEIVFWNFWNPLGPRSRLDLGLYDDDGNLSRHGEAILSLLNDRWRTQVDSSTEQNGAIEFRGTLGRYVAQWETTDGPVSAIFEVVAGPDTLDVVVVSAP